MSRRNQKRVRIKIFTVSSEGMGGSGYAKLFPVLACDVATVASSWSGSATVSWGLCGPVTAEPKPSRSRMLRARRSFSAATRVFRRVHSSRSASIKRIAV